MIPNGIFFYGAGGLYSYYLGIAMYLQENYDLKNVSFGGLSGGSIAAVALSAELMTKNSFDDFVRPCLKSIRDSNINNSIFGEKREKKSSSSSSSSSSGCWCCCCCNSIF